MSEKRSPMFGRLLKAGLNSISTIEGTKGPLLDEEIGAQVGLAGVSLQRYRSGGIPIDHELTRTLATVCVERGLMGRRWCERFLEAARYPVHEARALLGVLFPAEQRQHIPQPRSILPPPTYSHFVMRSAAFDAVLAGLRGELPATLIVSLGGMGKTSLARAVAGACVDGRHNAPHFAAVVWVSDQDQAGTTNLSRLLDTAARVLDYPGLAGLSFNDKLLAIEQLLRTLPTLLVVDNAETISDRTLLEWLNHVPAPSKALVTSRVALPAMTSACIVELGPMDAGESRELVRTWVARSRLRGTADAVSQLLPIAVAAGGNPKAIELALGLVQRRDLDDVLTGLVSAEIDTLFDQLFARAWALLDEAARRVLLAMPLFSASAPDTALAYIADLPPDALQRTADQLADLSLLDIERTDLRSPPRYAIHPLVRAFAGARLAEQPAVETTLRERWLNWCSELAAAVGFCWDDLDRLDRLDPEHETIQAALEWAATAGRDRETITLAEGVRYYYNVRGFWDERRMAGYELRATAAGRLGDASELVLTLAQRAEVLSKQATLDAAAELLAEAEAAAAGAELSSSAAFELGHARGLLAYARGDLAAAEAYWRDLLPFAAPLEPQKYVINRRWLATCLLEQGRTDEAAGLYRAALADAEACNDTRSVTGNSLKLAAIDLARGDLAAAEAALSTCYPVAERYNDRRRLAEYHLLKSRLLAAQRDIAGARDALQLAIELFERMGMRREAASARRELDGTPDPEAAPA